MVLLYPPILTKFFKLTIFFSLILLGACNMHKNESENFLSRNQNLPLFNPHMKDFACVVESEKLPPIDAQANTWFYEALSLDSAEISSSNRDYKKIVQLTQQAAERHHWKAMLNLASLYIGGYDPAHGEEDAVQLIEKAMQLGIPAAFDRMGTYYINGTGVKQDTTRAYAFWQRAAELGNPAAMAFLGKKIDATWDDPQGTFWGNRPIGIKMLECAFGQSDGNAAHELAQTYIIHPGRLASRYELDRALKILHEGVKFGSEECANKLNIEFSRPHNLQRMLVPYIDPARAARYDVFSDALGFDPSDRFPNLDKVLPLPPAKLPPWNGDRDTLLNAARGVTPPSAVPESTGASQRSGRYFLDAAYAFRDTGHETVESKAPMEGYWQPVSQNMPLEDRAQLDAELPGLYRRGEPFPTLMSQQGRGPLTGIVWHRWDTVRANPEAVEPMAAAGLVRIVPRPLPLMSCSSAMVCPVTGTWQPWLRSDHPLHLSINHYSRQVWLVEGQAFPQAVRDWRLPVSDAGISWHLMDARAVNLL